VPSPFPGMNPYLEQDDVWHDFHERFMPAAAELLLPQVRPNYIVTLDEHAYVHELPARERRLIGRPDVLVTEGRPGPIVAPARIVVTAPVYGAVPTAIDIEREAFIEVRDRASREIVAVIELLSPSNKRAGADREQYLAKREGFLRSPAHLVEVDLLRGGPRMPMEGLPECDYCAMVSRSGERPRVGLWPVRLRQPLPSIPIPLRPPDADASLELQQVVNRVYDAAGYEEYIYGGTPQPPLGADDLQWAHQFARETGRVA